MFSLKILRLLHILDLNRIPNPNHIKELDFFGVKALEYYSSRLDIMDVDIIYKLLELYNTRIRGEKSFFLKSIGKKNPLLYNLEYFDDEPFEVSECFSLYRGTLKTRENVSIKILRNNKNILEEDIISLKKIYAFSNYVPGIDISRNLKDFTDYCYENMLLEYSSKQEIENLYILRKKQEEYISAYPELKYLKFSKPFPYLSNEYISVTEFIENARTVALAINKKVLRKDALLNLVKVRLIYILEVGLFPRNLCNKNIVVDELGNFYFRNCYDLIYISENNRKNLVNLIKSLVNNDIHSAVETIIALSENDLSEKKYDIFRKEAYDFIAKNYSDSVNVSLVKLICNTFKIAIDSSLYFDTYIFETLKEFMFIKLLILNSGYKIELFSILEEFIQNQSSWRNLKNNIQF